MGNVCTMICKVILAFLLPPALVLIERGCSADFLINIGLSILGWIPGVIHALYILNKEEERAEMFETSTSP